MEIGLEWWRIWPGGERVRIVWNAEGETRTRLGDFDESFDLRLFRVALRRDVGGG